MGLLDDAIREHLELKRRHGATDDEIDQAEQEALGPARRDPSVEAGMPPLEAVPGEDVEDALPPPPPPPPLEDDESAPPPPVDDPVYADEYAAEPAPADLDEPELEPVSELPDLEEAPPPGTAKPHGDPALGDYREPVVDLDEPVLDPDDPVEDAAPPPAEGEDVLEETPEFLQDTPDHDKLWFEQKPPRDFDFE